VYIYIYVYMCSYINNYFFWLCAFFFDFAPSWSDPICETTRPSDENTANYSARLKRLYGSFVLRELVFQLWKYEPSNENVGILWSECRDFLMRICSLLMRTCYLCMRTWDENADKCRAALMKIQGHRGMHM